MQVWEVMHSGTECSVDLERLSPPCAPVFQSCYPLSIGAGPEFCSPCPPPQLEHALGSPMSLYTLRPPSGEKQCSSASSEAPQKCPGCQALP